MTDPGLTLRHGLLETVDAAARAGVGVIQLRDKNATNRDLYAKLVDVAAVVAGRCALLLDDRVDIVLAARQAGAAVDGVHLGQNDLPVLEARRMLGLKAVIGLTANATAHLEDLTSLPGGTVDYLGVGVIRPTATKPDHPAPLGVPGFGAIASATELPCIAIGGVRLNDVPALSDAGGAGVAVASAICSAPSPERAAREFVTSWTQTQVGAAS